MSQHDFDIANQTFPNTRADLNNALQALASNSSGASTPSTTYANQFFYETDTNKFFIRNEDNDANIQLFELDQTNDTVEYFVSDSMRTALLEFTDGTDALTIASDGKLTTSGHLEIGGSNNELRFYEGSNYVGFEAPALTGNQIFVLPSADGSANQVLKTNGSGTLSFTDQSTTTNPTISGVSPSTITNSATNVTISGTNFVTVPNVELMSTTGAITNANTVSFTNATTLVANITLPTDGNYFVRVENPDGLAVRSSSALLVVSDSPTWNISSGSLGSVASGGSMNFTTGATGDSTLTFSLVSGSLPSGASLNSSTGVISGTENGSLTSETTFTFTLRVTDAEGQSADLSGLSITVTVGINNSLHFNP